MKETKQEIKDRLLRHAAMFWGLEQTPAETDFDPLVSLLFGACATELQKISAEVEESRSRVLERLVQLLFPEVLTTALPAHGVAHAEPLENSLLLSDKTAFYVRHAAPQNGVQSGLTELYFTPAQNAKLCRSRIEYMATPQALYKTEAGGAKKYWTPLNASYAAAPANEVWLGISRPENLSPGCSFYFELRNEALKNPFYEGLQQAVWSSKSAVIETKPGYHSEADPEQSIDPAAIVVGKQNLTQQILQEVLQYYRQQFVTLHRFQFSGSYVAPPFFSELNAVAADKRPADNLLWVCLQFPATVVRQSLDDLNVHLNCFPVVNRRQYKLQQKLQHFINIIPLQPDSYFLDIESITNDEGRTVPQGMEQRDGLTASLRYGGVGRFSAKEAVTSLENIIQQIKDESAAYAVIGNDFLLAELTSLQQTINKLDEQLVNRQLQKGDNPHLVFSGNKETAPASVYINYWGTQGQDANNVKSGSPLFLLQNVELNSNNFGLLTNTTGGRKPLTESQKVLAYKAALLSKEKLVTKEDIISFCRMRTGLEEGRFAIEKGYDLSVLSNKSFTKTIDVKIQLSPASKEWLQGRGGIAATEKELAVAIEQRSNFFMPVRVFIQ
jgi:hypothetical protein